MAAEASPRVGSGIDIKARTALLVERTARPVPCATALGDGDATILGDLKDVNITDNSIYYYYLQSESTPKPLYPPLRPSENLDFLLFITVLRAYKAL